LDRKQKKQQIRRQKAREKWSEAITNDMQAKEQITIKRGGKECENLALFSIVPAIFDLVVY